VAQTLHQRLFALHQHHHQTHSGGKTVSLGLIRMANINPLVAAARALMEMPSPTDHCVHYCVYHSQHPLAMRSHIEARLDAALMRKDPQALWQVAEIRNAIEQQPQQHHLFVVLATSVAEVGRDHDYDWAIAEPSSMRSFIQLAGRILRHRQRDEYAPTSPNFYLLSHNVRALKGEKVVFLRPGFESKDGFTLASHDLREILKPEDYQNISAAPRIQQPPVLKEPFTLISLEHAALATKLFGPKNGSSSQPTAVLWWRKPLHWNGELQRHTPFRRSDPQQRYWLRLEDESEKTRFMLQDDGPEGWKKIDVIRSVEQAMADGVSLWVEMDYTTLYLQLAEEKQWELARVSDRFGEISISTRDNREWCWHPWLGVFGEKS
jgi:CRISPR-associated endonuclease/helicase Cas3